VNYDRIEKIMAKKLERPLLDQLRSVFGKEPKILRPFRLQGRKGERGRGDETFSMSLEVAGLSVAFWFPLQILKNLRANKTGTVVLQVGESQHEVVLTNPKTYVKDFIEGVIDRVTPAITGEAELLGRSDNLSILRTIVKDHSIGTVVFSGKAVDVDVVTANALLTVYDGLTKAPLKAKFEKLLNTSPAKFKKLVDLAWTLLK